MGQFARMTYLHAKSSCCQALVIRFGGRRRQCIKCHRTWRIRKKRRGRKRKRINLSLASRLLLDRVTVKQFAFYSSLSAEALKRRSRNTLKSLLHTLPSPSLSLPKGPLIIIGDGVWVKFKGRRFVLYVMAVRSLKGERAMFLDPILIEGDEAARKWRIAIERRMSKQTRKRVVAFVSDGFTGYKPLFQEYGWLAQRCHFHLIAMLQTHRGRHNKNAIDNRSMREEIYQLIRKLLIVKDKKELNKIINRLKRIINNPCCPKWMRRRGGGFLLAIDDFRAYLNHPKFNLPITTNSVENTAGSIRQLLQRSYGFKTPKSLILWTTALLRLRKNVLCRGANHQPN